MALIGTISGSNGTSTTAISGSLIVANRPDATFPSLPSGITFYVSGTKTSNGADQPSVLFTGDTFFSGALGTDTYFQMKPVGVLPIPTNTSASYIYTSGSTNDIYFTQYSGPYTTTSRLRWLESQVQTGVLWGGVISSTSGSTTYNISSGSGIIVSPNASLVQDPYPVITYVTWSNLTNQALPSIGSAQITYIAMSSSATPYLNSVPFSDGDYSSYIVLGRVLHNDFTGTNGAVNQTQVSYGTNQFRGDFIRAFGPIKLSGHKFYVSGTTGLKKDAGDSYAEGRNYTSDPNSPNYVKSTTDTAQNTSKIFYEYVNATGNDVILNNGNAGYAAVDFANYNNAGTLTTVGSGNKFTIQRVCWFPNAVNRAFYAYYGNAIYTTIVDAQTAIGTEVFIEGKNTRDAAILLGYLIVKGSGVNFTDPTTYKVIQAGAFRSVGALGGGGGGTGTPGGSDTQVQFNDADVFGGDAGLTYNKTTDTLTGVTIKATTGLSGSLTKLTDGTSYLIAGDYMTITTGANGAITIDSTVTTGPSGAMGPAGPSGSAGPTGSAGPSGSVGSKGDPGTSGSLWYSYAGTPLFPRNDNDQWLNTLNGDVYEYTLGDWALMGNIKGVTGDAGPTGSVGPAGPASIWTSGAGSPGGSGTNVGDQYLDTTSGDVYQWNGASWSVTGNIAGPTGSAGSSGSAGSPGSPGSTWHSSTGVPYSSASYLDQYLDTATGDIYQCDGGSSWTKTGNIQGPSGSSGSGGGGDAYFTSPFAGLIATTGSAYFIGQIAGSPPGAGSDTFFFVSGALNGKILGQGVAVAGGDAQVSGTLYIGSGSFGNLTTGSVGGGTKREYYAHIDVVGAPDAGPGDILTLTIDSTSYSVDIGVVGGGGPEGIFDAIATSGSANPNFDLFRTGTNETFPDLGVIARAKTEGTSPNAIGITWGWSAYAGSTVVALYTDTSGTVGSGSPASVPMALFVSGAIGAKSGSFPGASMFTGDLTVSGVQYSQSNYNFISASTGLSGAINHDLSRNSTFLHTSASADITINFINVDETDGQEIVTKVMFEQGATPHGISGLSINGAMPAAFKASGSPSTTAFNTDCFIFTMIRLGGNWIVLLKPETYASF